MGDTTRLTSGDLQRFATKAETSASDLNGRLESLIAELSGLVPGVWQGAASNVFMNQVVPGVRAEMRGLVATLNEIAADVRTGDTQLSTQDTTTQADLNGILSALSGA